MPRGLIYSCVKLCKWCNPIRSWLCTFPGRWQNQLTCYHDTEDTYQKPDEGAGKVDVYKSFLGESIGTVGSRHAVVFMEKSRKCGKYSLNVKSRHTTVFVCV